MYGYIAAMMSHSVGMGQIKSPEPSPEPRVIKDHELPYSEVCVYMRVAGKRMDVELRPNNMAQLFDTDGRPFSFPITRGEAGVPYDD